MKENENHIDFLKTTSYPTRIPGKIHKVLTFSKISIDHIEVGQLIKAQSQPAWQIHTVHAFKLFSHIIHAVLSGQKSNVFTRNSWLILK